MKALSASANDGATAVKGMKKKGEKKKEQKCKSDLLTVV